MNTFRLLVFVCMACSLARSEVTTRTPNDTKIALQEALAAYPEVGVASSPLNKAFVARLKLYRIEKPKFFEEADWGRRLAKECNDELASASGKVPADKPKTPAAGVAAKPEVGPSEERRPKLTHLDPSKTNGLKVKHRPYADMCAEIKKNGESLLLSDAEIARKLSAIPKGGYFTASVHSSTIEGANPTHFTAIVRDASGKEVLRKQGEDEIPEPPLSDGMWWAVFSVRLPEFTTQLQIRIVDSLHNVFSDFTLDP